MASQAQAATACMQASGQQRRPEAMAQDMVRLAPDCLGGIERSPVRPEVQSDGSYRITWATALGDSGFPRKH